MTFTKEDNSIVTRASIKFYHWLAKYIPDRVTPNMITISGFAPLMGFYIAWLNGFYYPLGISAGIFINHVFDYLDGIHARATSKTSSLGGYLDHFFDLVGILSVTHMTVFTLTDSYYHLYNIILLTICGAFLTHYETAVTKIMYFPEYISIGELQLFGAAIHLVNFITGWTVYMGKLLLPVFYLSAVTYLFIFLRRLKIKFNIASICLLFTMLLFVLVPRQLSNLSIINMSLAGVSLVEKLIYSHSFNKAITLSYTIYPCLFLETFGYNKMASICIIVEQVYKWMERSDETSCQIQSIDKEI